MYIELTHDDMGNIGTCYCEDSLPINDGEPLFTVKGMPADKEQVRVVIDTLTAMEIDQNTGEKAIINEQGKPEIIKIKRTTYIKNNFIVDMSAIIPKPDNMLLSDRLTLRRLIRKTQGVI